MNEIKVRAIPMRGQYASQFRRVHKAAFEWVQEDGEIVLFATEDRAKVAGWEAMAGHLTTLMRRDGCVVEGSARAAAEALFRKRGERHGEA